MLSQSKENGTAVASPAHSNLWYIFVPFKSERTAGYKPFPEKQQQPRYLSFSHAFKFCPEGGQIIVS